MTFDLHDFHNNVHNVWNVRSDQPMFKVFDMSGKSKIFKMCPIPQKIKVT